MPCSVALSNEGARTAEPGVHTTGDGWDLKETGDLRASLRHCVVTSAGAMRFLPPQLQHHDVDSQACCFFRDEVQNFGIDPSVHQLCVDLLDLQRLMELVVG
jgi:hypothetical protein